MIHLFFFQHVRILSGQTLLWLYYLQNITEIIVHCYIRGDIKQQNLCLYVVLKYLTSLTCGI